MNSLNKGDSNKAIDIFSDMIKSRNKKSTGYALRGVCYLRTHKYANSLTDLIESIKIKQFPELNIVLLAKFFCEFEEYDIALKYLLKANKLKPNSGIVNLNLGLIYYYNKEYNKAIKYFNTLLKSRISKTLMSSVYSNLGAIYIDLREYDKADKNISEALSTDPKNGSAYRNYANLLRIKGDNSLAKKYALQAINLDYYDYLAYKILAEINLAQNNYEEFYKNFKIFLNKKPSGLHCKNIEASIYNKVKNDEKFDMLIKESNKNILTLNELNITVDHNSLMSYKSYKKQRIIYFLKISLVCLLLFISVYFILNT
jgi:tetratricopeptide (TPR) repeat protein